MSQLNPQLLEILRRVYKDNNHAFYLKQCKEPFDLPDALLEVIETAGYWFASGNTLKEDIWPSVRYYITVPSFIEGNFQVDYGVELEVSKLVPAYRLNFTYEIENNDPDRLAPVFHDFSDHPFTQCQMKFIEAWQQVAQELGWERIQEAQSQELFLKESIWRCLSYDLLELCPE